MFQEIYNKCTMLLVTKTQVLLTVLWFAAYIHDFAAKSLQSCPTQRPHGLKPTRLLYPWDFPGKSTGVGCHCLLQDQISLSISKMHINPP